MLTGRNRFGRPKWAILFDATDNLMRYTTNARFSQFYAKTGRTAIGHNQSRVRSPKPFPGEHRSLN